MEENKIVIENPQSTVVAKYEADEQRETDYQSEAALEKAFIEFLDKDAEVERFHFIQKQNL